MIKRLLVSMLTLLLAACFESLPPQIAAADLSFPPDLEGQYWAINGGDSSEVGAIGFGRRASGLVTIDATGEDSPIRLVGIVPPDLYLLVDDGRELRSTYYFLRRGPGGSWMLLDINVPQDMALGGAYREYADRIARRHGLTIDEPDDSTTILGDVSTGAIPELFRDREFLGGLTIGVLGVYLPSGGKFAKPQELSLIDFEFAGHGSLRIEQPLPAGRGLADPKDLAGVYLDERNPVEVRRGAAGIFVYGPVGKPDTTLRLVPFSPDEGRYLAVAERTDRTEEGPVVYRDLRLMERRDDGWVIVPIWLVARPYLPELAQTLEGMMSEAAGHHGLTYANGRLEGLVEPANLVSLMRDGQFIAGLRVDRDLQVRLIREGTRKPR